VDQDVHRGNEGDEGGGRVPADGAGPGGGLHLGLHDFGLSSAG
jgi:hypothetical protein